MLKIACAQLQPEFGKVDENLEMACAAMREAAAAGSQLVVLPGAHDNRLHVHNHEEAYSLSEELPGGPACQRLLQSASELGVYTVVGVAEHFEGRLFNAACVIGPDGFVGRFRKVHLWDREPRLRAG